MAPNREKLIQVFCKLSGYSPEDVMSINETAYTFSTYTGGKYQLSRDGKKLRIISGPAYPNIIPPTEITVEEV